MARTPHGLLARHRMGGASLLGPGGHALPVAQAGGVSTLYGG
jgi:hypothetical protein